MDGIKIKIDDGKVSIDITEVKDKLIEQETGNLLVEYIDEKLIETDFGECNDINEQMDRGNLWVSGGLMGVTAKAYFMGNREIIELKETGKTTLEPAGGLEDYIDTSKKEHIEFLYWFYCTNDTQEAVQMLYDDCGWVVTDIDTHQAYKEVEEDEVYLFRELRTTINDDGVKVEEMYESEMRYDEYDWWQIVEGCESFGYKAEEISKWIDHGEEVPFILEMLFELES